MFQSSTSERQGTIDWLMIAAIFGLMIIGVAFVYSATLVSETSLHPAWYNQHGFRQLIWYALGLTALSMIAYVDYLTIARWSMVAYAGTILFLILVLIPKIGAERFGARRWIDFGAFQFQPSEFAKLSFILAMAGFLSRPADELRSMKVFWKAIGLIALPFLLILKEPDLGSALILLPVGLTMLFVAGVPPRYINILMGVAGLAVTFILVDVLFAPPGWWKVKLEDYQKRRLLVYFGMDGLPSKATPEQRQEARRVLRNYSYNVEQALLSVGSGGLVGKGWRQGTQNALGYLPRAVAHNDFIFSVIAEEKGFVGSATVLLLYSVVLFTGIRIAGQARDRLGKLLAVGVVTMLFSHVFINIGMNIRLMPVTGVPLPLLSYGGSSVLCALIAAGFLQSVYIHRRS